MDHARDRLPPNARGIGWFVLLVLPLLLLSLPVLLPVAALLVRRDRRRRCAAARITRCGRCGALLGEAALDRADADWAAHVAQLRRDHPTVRFRLVQRLHALCGTCDTPYEWDEKARAFVQLSGAAPGDQL